MPRQCAVRRPKRRAARKRRSVREACRGRPREAADCSKWHAAGRVGLPKTAVRLKVALPGYEDCAIRVCVEVLIAMVCRTGRAAARRTWACKFGCHAVVPLESACGACADMVRRVHALRARCGCLRRLPWVGEYVPDSLLISSKHLGKNGLILSLVDRRLLHVSCELQRLCPW